MHHLTLCPNALWNSHQASLREPKNRSVFWGNFSLSATPNMLKSSLHDTRNLGLIIVSSLALVSGSSFLATYGTYLRSVLFSVEASLLLLERSRLFSLCLGCFDREPSFFLSTTSVGLNGRASLLTCLQLVLQDTAPLGQRGLYLLIILWRSSQWEHSNYKICFSLKYSEKRTFTRGLKPLL